METAHIIVIGGGFGGVYAVKDLLRKGYKVTLISQTNFFVFSPLLHEVATGSLHSNDITFEYSSFFNNKNFTFFREQVTSIDFDKLEIHTSDGEVVSYDYLVVSTGASTNFFGSSGSELALTLKSIPDAQLLKSRVVKLAQGLERDISINIVGGGPTGVELALEIKEYLALIKKHSPSLKYLVRLIHSGDSLCPVFPPWIQSYALKRMNQEGVEVRFETYVKEIKDNGVVVQSGELIPGDLTVWSAGVTPNTDIVPSGYKDERGNVIVEKTLLIQGREREFAVGDVIGITGEAVPKLAQTAMHQGILVAENIHRQIGGKELKPYKVKADNQLLSLGKGHGAAKIFGLRLKGFFAWLVWRFAYLTKIPGFRNKLEVFGTWFINLFSSRDLYEN